MQQLQLTKEQIPQFLEDRRRELAAVDDVIAIKQSCIAHLDEMDRALENPPQKGVEMALRQFSSIQRIEYTLQLRSLEEKRIQLSALIKQIESQAGRRIEVPSGPIPFKAPRV